MANNGKLSSPANTRCGRIDSGIGEGAAMMMKAVPVRATNIGTERNSPVASSPKINAMVMARLRRESRSSDSLRQSCKSMVKCSPTARGRQTCWHVRRNMSALPTGMAR